MNPNPVELIDKQKLAESLRKRMNDQRRWGNPTNIEIAREISAILGDLEDGSFDDHSAQEEIAKLKEELRDRKEYFDIKQQQVWRIGAERDTMEARAIQAEQDADRWSKEAVTHLRRAEQAEQELDRMRDMALQLDSDKEAQADLIDDLLEGLKGMLLVPVSGEVDEWGDPYNNESLKKIRGLARSIIAKIEGSKPDVET